MIRCIAIDDEPAALKIIEIHASKVPFVELVKSTTDPFEAVSFANENKIDLIFLDINMPDIDGLSLVKSFSHNPLIIFTTAHSEYAVQSYEIQALDYLLKPFDAGRFLTAVTKAKSKMEETSVPARDYFFVNTGSQSKRLFYNDILYVEGEGNYVKYYTSEGKLLVRASIRETMESLPKSNFVQVHRSYLVALSKIEKIMDNHVHVSDQKIPISASYKEGFMRLISGQ